MTNFNPPFSPNQLNSVGAEDLKAESVQVGPSTTKEVKSKNFFRNLPEENDKHAIAQYSIGH